MNEIRNGKKKSHWIWYVFPLLKGLGYSPNAQNYGIFGTEEARAFLEHPVLETRLREITEALLACENKTADEILSPVDATKVRSCMTLFDLESPDDIFRKVLEKYYDGQRDPLTLKMTDCVI